MSWLRRWWEQGDQFEWMTQFLRQRGLLHSARLIMATVAGSAALVPLSFLVGLQQPTTQSLAVGAMAVAFTVALTGYWLVRWPSRRQSELAVISGTLFVAVWSLAQPTPAVAVLACTATAATGGYMALFHSTKLLVFNFVTALAIAIVASVRLERDTDLATAIAAFWLIWFLNLSVPVAARGTSRALRVYTLRSDTDPLTGLLNRRAFVEIVNGSLADPDPDATHVTVVMIDLDDFKGINDTHGHAAGDLVLLEVAELLQHHNPPTGAVCRAGGEEFLIAIFGEPIRAQAATRRLCADIATLPHGVTASIGTTSVVPNEIGDLASGALVENLIAAADRAMYAAKRNGGNRVHHG